MTGIVPLPLEYDLTAQHLFIFNLPKSKTIHLFQSNKKWAEKHRHQRKKILGAYLEAQKGDSRVILSFCLTRLRFRIT